jgi:hypothetical protein
MFRRMEYILRRGRAWLKRRLRQAMRRNDRVPGGAREDMGLPYGPWLDQRLRDRRQDYPAAQEKGLFSILTPVFDPPAGFFRILGESILGQDHRDWEWVLVDNGCRQRDVLFLLERFARDARVKLIRAGEPRGIIGGMRLALESASGRYVCPVDHDDRLYPDALRVVAACLSALDWPAIAYTDEDKLLPDGGHDHPFFKPDWDPLLFLNCCYVAHLGVMDRQKSLELGVYSDPRAEGTPDGDAFCRFVAAGYQPVHIPEVVYSWRMHPGSTAMLGIEAKPYVIASQQHALGRYLRESGLAPATSLRGNPLPGTAGCWRVCAGETEPKKLPETIPVLVLPGGRPALRAAVIERLERSADAVVIECGTGRQGTVSALEHVAELPGQSWMVVIDPACLPLTTDFVREFKCVLDAVPDAVLAGGVVLSRRGAVESAGWTWGFDGILGSPLRGEKCPEFGDRHPGLCFQRCTSGVDGRFFFARSDFLLSVATEHQTDLDDPLLSAWLAAAAREGRAGRILFTPFVVGQMQPGRLPRRISAEAVNRFLHRFGDHLRQDPYYSPFLGLGRRQAFRLVRPEQRARALNRLLCGLAGSAGQEVWLVAGSRHLSPLEWLRSGRSSAEETQSAKGVGTRMRELAA